MLDKQNHHHQGTIEIIPSWVIKPENLLQPARKHAVNKSKHKPAAQQIMKTPHMCKSITILWVMMLVVSCQSDLQTIDAMTHRDDGPVESAFDVEIIYSDHGYIRMLLQAEQMDRFENEQTYLELPRGLHVVFFDTLKKETSSMSARYAISYEDTEIIEARNDVVVINELGEQLNTEQLIWDQKNATIHSDKFVKITTENEVLYGQGFEADERFDQWRILRPYGTIRIDTRENTE
ncbi:MAG: LPS export ABC transporter periplasmic protein LptC [Bacteroidia bacterium]|nr:MAG: LPS export ABC transporter periplasmic protein LptC [Bacteroidia bacterium]